MAWTLWSYSLASISKKVFRTTSAACFWLRSLSCLVFRTTIAACLSVWVLVALLAFRLLGLTVFGCGVATAVAVVGDIATTTFLVRCPGAEGLRQLREVATPELTSPGL